MSRASCLVLTPEEAAYAVADWPEDAWLIVTCHARQCVEGARWEAVDAGRLGEALAGCAVWPPIAGMDVASIDPWEEMSLLEQVSSCPGLGQEACLRMQTVVRHGVDISSDEVDW
jgi:hypothetical protein